MSGYLAERERGRQNAEQQICDVERMRAREEIRGRLHIENLRQVALKISKNLSREDKADLARLVGARFGEFSLPPDLQRRAEEMISEIYTGAMARAGIKEGQAERIEGTGWSMTTSMQQYYFAGSSYVNIISGRAQGETARVGDIVGVYLGANPDQSRYYVTLLRLYRTETRGDGRTVPLYEGISFSDYVESWIRQDCLAIKSGLDAEDFDTVPGLQPEPRSRPPLP